MLSSTCIDARHGRVDLKVNSIPIYRKRAYKWGNSKVEWRLNLVAEILKEERL